MPSSGIDTEIVCQPGNFPYFKQTQPDTSTQTIVTSAALPASHGLLGIEAINNEVYNFYAGAPADVLSSHHLISVSWTLDKWDMDKQLIQLYFLPVVCLGTRGRSHVERTSSF